VPCDTQRRTILVPRRQRPIGEHLDFVKSAVAACWFQLIIARNEQMAVAKLATSESAPHTFASHQGALAGNSRTIVRLHADFHSALLMCVPSSHNAIHS